MRPAPGRSVRAAGRGAGGRKRWIAVTQLLGVTLTVLMGSGAAAADSPVREPGFPERDGGFRFRLHTGPVTFERVMPHASIFGGIDAAEWGEPLPEYDGGPAGGGGRRTEGWTLEDKRLFWAVGIGQRFDLGLIEISLGGFGGSWRFAGEREWHWQQEWAKTHTESLALTETVRVQGSLMVLNLLLHWPALIAADGPWRFSLGPEVGVTWTEQNLEHVDGGDPELEARLRDAYDRRTAFGFPLGLRLRCRYSAGLFEVFVDLACAHQWGEFEGDQVELDLGLAIRF